MPFQMNFGDYVLVRLTSDIMLHNVYTCIIYKQIYFHTSWCCYENIYLRGSLNTRLTCILTNIFWDYELVKLISDILLHIYKQIHFRTSSCCYENSFLRLSSNMSFTRVLTNELLNCELVKVEKWYLF